MMATIEGGLTDHRCLLCRKGWDASVDGSAVVWT